MSYFPFYGVFKRLDEREVYPYYVLETFHSIDGARTRVSRGGFKTEQEAKDWIEKNKPRNHAERNWKKLIGLAGHWQDGSCETVSFGWDDATRTANITVGKNSYSGSSFDQVLMEIPDVE